MNPIRPRQRGAFSLVEVLVVVSIIVLILALLVPSLSTVRLTARELVCKSNMRQQGFGLSLYANANRKYPGAHTRASNGQAVAIWPTRLRTYVGSQEVWYDPAAPPSFAWQQKTGTPGGIYATVADDEWGYNPGELLLNINTVPSCYGYNDWGRYNVKTDPQRGLGADIRSMVAVEELSRYDVVNPSNMIAITESVSDGRWDWNVDPTDPFEYPGKYHREGTNVLHVDGHVDWFLQADLVDVDTSTLKGQEMSRKWNNHDEWWHVEP